MRRIAISVFFCFVTFVVARPASAQTSKGELTRAEVEKKSVAFQNAFEKGDLATVSAFYADDAIVLPPDSDMVKGRPRIEAFVKNTRDAGGKSLDLQVLDVQSSGNLAVETGTAVLHVQSAGHPESTVKTKYVVVWKKQNDGKWKIIRNVWNRMEAASTTAPAKAMTPEMAMPPPKATAVSHPKAMTPGMAMPPPKATPHH